MGGKWNLLKHLIPLIPPHRTYVEAFGGGAYLLLNKKPSLVEVYNDIDGELVNLFMTVRDSPGPFIRRVASLPYSRQLYEKYRKQIIHSTLSKDRIERAVRYYYCIRSAFYGHIEKGWRFALKTREANRLYNAIGEIEDVAKRLRDVYIDNVDFRRCLNNWDGENTFFYLDPPYPDATPYRRGLKPFQEADHEDLAGLLGDVEGKWLLTYSDTAPIRKLYAQYPMIRIRQALACYKTVLGESRPRWAQLIIRNYRLPNESLRREI